MEMATGSSLGSFLWESLAFSGVRALAAEACSDETFTQSRKQMEKQCNFCRYLVLLKTFQTFIPEHKSCLQQHGPPTLLPTCHLLTIQSFTALWQGSSIYWGNMKQLEFNDPENPFVHFLSLSMDFLQLIPTSPSHLYNTKTLLVESTSTGTEGGTLNKQVTLVSTKDI